MFGVNPGRIINEFKVELPRPRHIETPEFIELRAPLLKQIRKEVEESAMQEYDNN